MESRKKNLVGILELKNTVREIKRSVEYLTAL